jgi:superfamily I DNA and RNA helicase
MGKLEEDALSLATPIYDAVIIDEYQDFSDKWLQLIKKVAKKHSYREESIESIFLCGDKLQQIRRPEDAQNWKELGYKVQGRSRFLSISYRSCPNHLKLALAFLGKSALNAYSTPELEMIVNHHHISSSVKEGDLKIQEGDINECKALLSKLLNEGISPRDILVTAPKSELLRKRKILDEYNKKGVNFESTLKIKGIEYPVVIVLDSDTFAHPYINETNRKRTMYMTLTRSNYALYIFGLSDNGYFSEIKAILQNDLALDD